MGVIFHFLNVGAGDTTVVHFPSRTVTDTGRIKDERIMVVDFNLHEDHDFYENAIAYYKNKFRNSNGTLKPIFRLICTHPHHDHFCGLHKLLGDNEIKVYNFWDHEHDYVPESFEGGHPWFEDDWKAYKKIEEKGIHIVNTTRDSAKNKYWDDEEDKISVLSPSKELLHKAHFMEDGTKRDSKDIDVDLMSYALLIRVNKTKVILAGDGKEEVWEDILIHCADEIKDCHLLKAAHHGHLSGFHEEALKLMNPKYIVFSNGSDEDEKDGAEEEYKKILPNAIIYKTHELGNIVFDCTFDGQIKFIT